MRIRSALAATALVVIAGAATAPAGAVPGSPAAPGLTSAVTYFSGSDCPAESLCLYRDYNFTGGGVAIRSGDVEGWLGVYNFNDQMSSWSNDSGALCHWTVDAYFAGDSHDMINGYRVNVLSNENDRASAVRCG